MTNLEEQMQDLYGPQPQFSDYKQNEHITYTQAGETHTGVIIWVCGPGNVAGQHLPTHYIVERDGTGDTWPDTVYQSDIIGTAPEAEDDTQEIAIMQCPWCSGWHQSDLVKFCPNNPHRER